MERRYLSLEDAIQVVRDTVSEGMIEATLELRLLDRALNTDVVEHVYGEWIPVFKDNPTCMYKCSICGAYNDVRPNFCFQCGSDNRKINKESDKIDETD